MGSVNDEITRINDAKTAINAAITECGVQMPAPEDATIDTYAGKIREIPTAVLSQLNMDSVGGTDLYIKQLSQTNGVITATQGSIANTSSSGLTPKLSAADGQVGEGYVLCYGSQDTEPKWKQLVLPFASYSDFWSFVNHAETTYATKVFVDQKIAALVDSAPEHLNTLKELADALGSDSNMSTSLVALIATKLDMYAQSFEMNKTGQGGGHGGFIDFHYHDKSNKPTDVNGNVVTATPDYTSRIIEDDPGELKINGVKFKSNVVTATSYNILGSNTSTAVLSSDLATNCYIKIGSAYPLVVKYDAAENGEKFVACGASYNNMVTLGTSSRKWKEVHATTFKGTLVNNTIGTWINAAKNPAVNITNVTAGSAGSVFTTPLKDGYITVQSFRGDNILRFNYFTTDKYTNSTNTPFASLHIEADTGNVIATTFTGNLIGTSSDTEGLKSLGQTQVLTGTSVPEFAGLTMREYYNADGTPAKFGNLIQMKGKDAAGCSELFCEWTSNSVSGKLHYRSKRDMSNPWGAWKTMIDSDGGAIYKSLQIYNDAVNYAQIQFINTRAKADGGGWATTILNLQDNVGTTLALFGMHGDKGALTYLYLGTGAYGANNNLRIYPDKVQTPTILPNVTNTYSLGSSSLKWSTVYATTFYGSLSGNASSATTLGILGSATNSSYPLVFAPSVNTSTSTKVNKTLYTSTTDNFTYNPSKGSVSSSGGFFDTSDERLKTIINPISVDLDKLSKLRKVYFSWKDKPDSDLQLGMIAQDVQELYPELVSETNGQLSLSYEKLSVIALKGIDVLYDLVLDLKSEIKELKCKLNEYYGG